MISLWDCWSTTSIIITVSIIINIITSIIIISNYSVINFLSYLFYCKCRSFLFPGLDATNGSQSSLILSKGDSGCIFTSRSVGVALAINLPPYSPRF